MKPNIFQKMAFAGVAMLCFASCSDLDTPIDSKYTKYPDNPIAINAQLEGCYYYQRSEAWFSRNFWEGVMLQGDEMMAVCYNNGYYDNGRAVLPSLHLLNPDIPGVGLMSDMMSGISYCNQVILSLGGEEGADADIVAPVRAMRAYYTFWMMDLYGDVPILDPKTMPDDGVPRSPRKDVARWVESELKAVYPKLTEEVSTDTYGRPTKWMALATLAKLYLNWGVYTADDVKDVDNNTPNEKLNDLVAVCDSIIKSGKFEVGRGYRKKFFPNNGVQIKDFIYAIPYDAASLGASYAGGHHLDRFCIFKKANSTTPGPWGFAPAKSSAGTWIVTDEATARFNLKGDERNEMILKGPQYTLDYANNYAVTTTPVMYHGKQIDYTPISSVADADWQNINNLDLGPDNVDANLQKGYRLAKYVSDPDQYRLYNRFGSNDIPIYRYADILLMKAEAILRGATATNGDTPQSLINQVRDCSGAEHIGANVTLQDLLDERSREFICEPWRRNDLIRFGQFENDWGLKNKINPDAKAKWRRLLPIPTGEMDTNTNWKQNEGYSTK